MQNSSQFSWNDFLLLLKKYKTLESGQIHLDAGSLITMLYAGEFDSILGIEKPTAELYKERSEEIKKAIGSKAQDKKAGKNEDYGIVDINKNCDDIVLKLWRSESNPIYQFDWMQILHEEILQTGFYKYKGSPMVPYLRYSKNGKTRHDLWTSWKDMCDAHRALSTYLSSGYTTCPAFIGVIVDSTKMKYSNGTKEAIKFKIFTGIDETETITCWPKKDESCVSDVVAKTLKKGNIGIAAVSLKMWNDKPSPSLSKWDLIEK